MRILLASIFLALITGGCADLSVNFTQATSPQFWAVENQTQAQHNQIDAAVQAQQIPFTIGEGLTLNDEIIRRLNHQFRDKSSGATDLSPSQALLLGHMLKDNNTAFTDAVDNPDDWQDSFSQEDAYIQNNHSPLNQDFVHFNQRARFIVYLNMRLKEDSAKAQSLAQSGQLGVEQAQDLRSNFNDVQNKAVEDYYANGRLDLSVDQIFQLRRMLADSYAALNPPQAPVYGGGGGFPGGGYNIPSNNWSTNAPAGASGYSYYNPPSNGSGPSAIHAPTPVPTTSNPTAVPTATPKLGGHGSLESLRANHHNPNSSPYSLSPGFPTMTPVPPTPVPTNTPVPMEVDTPTEVPFTAPVNTPVPAAVAPPANNPAPTANSAGGNSSAQNNPGNGPRSHNGGRGSMGNNSNPPAPQDTPTLSPSGAAVPDDTSTGPGN